MNNPIVSSTFLFKRVFCFITKFWFLRFYYYCRCKDTKKNQTRHVSQRNVWQFDENSVILWRKTKKKTIIWETISIISLHLTVFVR